VSIGSGSRSVLRPDRRDQPPHEEAHVLLVQRVEPIDHIVELAEVRRVFQVVERHAIDRDLCDDAQRPEADPRCVEEIGLALGDGQQIARAGHELHAHNRG
jgi:hypothetical protein